MKLHNIQMILTFTILTACGQGKPTASINGTDKTVEGTDPSAVSQTNTLAVVYPTSLAITAFPTSSSSTSLADDESFQLADDTTAVKNDRAAKILKGGEGGTCLPDSLKPQGDTDFTDDKCYEFDQDMIYGAKDGKTFLGTKDGKNSKGEACLVGFARAKIRRVVNSVDRSLGMIQMMLCQAKQRQSKSTAVAFDLSKVGATIDLTATMANNEAQAVPSVAKITRLDDVVDGDKTYKSFKSEVVVVRQDGVAMSIKLFHVQKDADNKSFYGVLQISEQLQDKDNVGEGGSGAADGKKRMMSVSYGRDTAADGTPTVAYELRNGLFHKDLVAKAYGSDNLLDLNAGGNFSVATSDAKYGKYSDFAADNLAIFGITYISFSGNPNTNVGTFSYWQNPGSSYTENARGMVAKLEDAGGGLLKGCAYTGAVASDQTLAFSIRKALKEGKSLEPKGFFHPFFNNSTANNTDTIGKFFTKTVNSLASKWYLPENTTNGNKFVTAAAGNLITKQCYTQDATSRMYNIDTSVIKTAKGYEYVETAAATSIAPPPTPIFKGLPPTAK